MTPAPDAARAPVPAPIAEGRIIAIGRGLEPDRVARIADGLVTGGIRAFEITLNSPDALGAIESLAGRLGDELLVGAGTVLTAGAAASAVDAGARFIVAPDTNPDLLAWALERQVPCFPGAFSPTEVHAAWRAGATAVKLFPASGVGPAYVRELRGPFPEIPIVPTGGITLETAPTFIAAGAVAVGLGSWLTGDGDAAAIADRGVRLVAAIAEARGV